MKIRGIVQQTYSGSASRGHDEPFLLSLVLRPWRDRKGALKGDDATVWTYADEYPELEAKRASAPPVGALIEVVVETPDRIHGLKSKRRSREFQLVSWEAIVDNELRAFVAPPPGPFTDPELGTFAFEDPGLGEYQCQRTVSTGTYELACAVADPYTPPKRDIALMRAEVAWLEANLGAVRAAVAELMWPMWDEGWRQPDEVGVDRAAFEAALTLSRASFDNDAPARYQLIFADGELFGGHWITVEIAERRVVSAGLAG